MNRRHFMTALCIGVLTAGMAQAASYEEAVVAQLRAQGYKKIEVERTLLGRLKISATLDGGRREIILNPRTGEVLRDLWIATGGGGSVPAIIGSNGGSGGGSGSGGSGSGGSGSGGSGSGDDGEDDDNGGEDNGGEDSGGEDNGGGEDSGGDDGGEDENED